MRRGGGGGGGYQRRRYSISSRSGTRQNDIVIVIIPLSTPRSITICFENPSRRLTRVPNVSLRPRETRPPTDYPGPLTDLSINNFIDIIPFEWLFLFLSYTICFVDIAGKRRVLRTTDRGGDGRAAMCREIRFDRNRLLARHGTVNHVCTRRKSANDRRIRVWHCRSYSRESEQRRFSTSTVPKTCKRDPRKP